MGEEVTVVVDDHALFRGAVAGYGLPLLGLFLGATLGAALAGDLGSMLGAAGGLVVSWGLQGSRRVREFFSGPDSEPRIR